MARQPASPELAFFLCRKVGGSGDVANLKQRIAIFGTRAPAYAMLVFRESPGLVLGLDSDANQIFLRGQRQGARRLSLGLHPTGQQQSQAVVQKTYVHCINDPG